MRLVLPGTREGGSEWGRGKTLGSLLLKVSHPAYHQASLLWNSLLPCTVGHIKKRDQRTEPERERDGEGGQEGLRVAIETLQALPSKSHQPREDEEERKTEKDGLEEGRGGERRRAGEERQEKKRHRQVSRLTLVPGIPAATV